MDMPDIVRVDGDPRGELAVEPAGEWAPLGFDDREPF